jgi:hypothetical protein
MSDNVELRLLKLLILRLYTMLSVNPLRWYEMLISVVCGALFGVGLGAILSSYVKAFVR